MKILLINDYLNNLGGAEKILFDTKFLLEEKGHEVRLIGGHKNFFSFFSRWLSIKYFIRTLYEINHFKPDIVHCHNISRCVSPSPLIAAKIKKIPIIMTFHDYHLICPKTWMIYSDGKPCKYGFCRKCLYSNCYCNKKGIINYPYHWIKWIKVLLHRFIIQKTVDFGTSPSIELSKSLEKSIGIKIFYLPNFILNNIEKKYKKKYKKKYFLFVGRLSKEKGIDIAINAMEIFLKKYSNNYQLLIVGSGPEEIPLKMVVKNKNLSNKILFLGKIDHNKLGKYYNNAISLLVPSMGMESFGLILLEASIYKTFSIYSNTGGLKEVANKIGNSYSFNRGDYVDLSRKMILLINHHKEFKGVKMSDFQPSNFIKKIIDIYLYTLKIRSKI